MCANDFVRIFTNNLAISNKKLFEIAKTSPKKAKDSPKNS